VQTRAEGVPISGPILKAQSEKFHTDLHGHDLSFKASSGWLNRFKKRHGISHVTISGEIRSSDSEAAMNYSDQLREIIEEGGYSPEQIYNCDETGLCYKMMPDTTLAVKNDQHKHEGYKKIKERLTLPFCVNKREDTNLNHYVSENSSLLGASII